MKMAAVSRVIENDVIGSVLVNLHLRQHYFTVGGDSLIQSKVEDLMCRISRNHVTWNS